MNLNDYSIWAYKYSQVAMEIQTYGEVSEKLLIKAKNFFICILKNESKLDKIK